MKKDRIVEDQIGSVALLTATMLAAGLGIVVARPSRCSGARSSVRLQFKQQKAEIEAQISASENSKAAQGSEVVEGRADGQ